MAEQYISIREILDDVRRHPMLQQVTMESVVDYTVKLMRIIGVPNIFVNKVVTAETHDHRVKLPCDYIEMRQMRGKMGVYHKATDTFHFKPEAFIESHSKCDCQTDALNQKRKCGKLCLECPNRKKCDEMAYGYNGIECVSLLSVLKVRPQVPKGNTYITQNGVIFLSNREDIVDISYLAVMTDGEGYPMIPDNEKFKRALTSYIKKEEFGIRFDMGELHEKVMMKAEQDYAWAVGAASSAMNWMDLPALENLSQAMHGIINRRNEYDKQFVTNAKPIVQKIH